MKKQYFHIILSLLLTIAVSDYVWVELLDNHLVVAELEIEKEKEYEEELVEKNTSDTKHFFLDLNGSVCSNSFLIQNSFTGFFKHGNSYCPHSTNTNPKLFVLHQQLRLHC